MTKKVFENKIKKIIDEYKCPGALIFYIPKKGDNGLMLKNMDGVTLIKLSKAIKMQGDIELKAEKTCKTKQKKSKK